MRLEPPRARARPEAERYAAMLVRQFKVSPPVCMRICMSFAGYAVNIYRFPKRIHLTDTIEGILERLATHKLFSGVSSHGAPIPVKRAVLGGSRVYCASYPILRAGKEYWAPYKALYARAEVSPSGVVIDSSDTVGFDYFLSEAGYVRGSLFDIYYDFARLGAQPAKSVDLGSGKFVFDPSRGPLKQRLSTLTVLNADVCYLVAVPRIALKTRLNPLDLLREPVGYGWKGLGVLLNVDVAPIECKPEAIMTAKTKDGGAVALRPLPSPPAEPEGPEWLILLRDAPPYWLARRSDKRVGEYVAEGAPLRGIPAAEFER